MAAEVEREEEWEEEVIEWLEDWREAYSTKFFADIDMRDVEKRKHSYDEVMSIAQRNAAGLGRHVLEGIIRRLHTRRKEREKGLKEG